MICYNKLFELMKAQGKTQTQIRECKIIGQETLRKLKIGSGVFENGYDPNNYIEVKDENGDIVLDENGKPKKKQAIKTRITSVDSKSIESLCAWLNCQPGDIMEYIPNTWVNADRLCEVLKCSREELVDKLPMEGNPLETE